MKKKKRIPQLPIRKIVTDIRRIKKTMATKTELDAAIQTVLDSAKLLSNRIDALTPTGGFDTATEVASLKEANDVLVAASAKVDTLSQTSTPQVP